MTHALPTSKEDTVQIRYGRFGGNMPAAYDITKVYTQYRELPKNQRIYPPSLLNKTGWMALWIKFNKFITENINDVEIHTVDTTLGFMRIVVYHPIPLIQEMLDRLCWSVERTTAVTCEICSKAGVRRKLNDSVEVLCHPDYVKRLNEVTQ